MCCYTKEGLQRWIPAVRALRISRLVWNRKDHQTPPTLQNLVELAPEVTLDDACSEAADVMSDQSVVHSLQCIMAHVGIGDDWEPSSDIFPHLNDELNQ